MVEIIAATVEAYLSWIMLQMSILEEKTPSKEFVMPNEVWCYPTYMNFHLYIPLSHSHTHTHAHTHTLSLSWSRWVRWCCISAVKMPDKSLDQLSLLMVAGPPDSTSCHHQTQNNTVVSFTFQSITRNPMFIHLKS